MDVVAVVVARVELFEMRHELGDRDLAYHLAGAVVIVERRTQPHALHELVHGRPDLIALRDEIANVGVGRELQAVHGLRQLAEAVRFRGALGEEFVLRGLGRVLREGRRCEAKRTPGYDSP